MMKQVRGKAGSQVHTETDYDSPCCQTTVEAVKDGDLLHLKTYVPAIHSFMSRQMSSRHALLSAFLTETEDGYRYTYASCHI